MYRRHGQNLVRAKRGQPRPLDLLFRRRNGANRYPHRQREQESLIPQMKEATVAMTASMEKVNSALGTLIQDKVFENLGTIASNLSIASTSIDKMCQNLNSGQSTLGKMINADDMYLRLTAVMSKADTMMNDINHYGVLFHLNKGWQRTHTKRISQLEPLTPLSPSKIISNPRSIRSTPRCRASRCSLKKRAKRRKQSP